MIPATITTTATTIITAIIIIEVTKTSVDIITIASRNVIDIFIAVIICMC